MTSWGEPTFKLEAANAANPDLVSFEPHLAGEWRQPEVSLVQCMIANSHDFYGDWNTYTHFQAIENYQWIFSKTKRSDRRHSDSAHLSESRMSMEKRNEHSSGSVEVTCAPELPE